MRFALAACVIATTLIVGGCGSATRASSVASATSVQVRVTTYDPRSHNAADRRYTLRCNPTSGSLPFADRICADVARHPVSMLAPGRARSLCGGRIFGPVIEVKATRNGRTSSFGGQPGCGWPGGAALAVYWAASIRDTKWLSIFEPRLRCDDDPRLLAMPPRWPSIAACMHGRWTPRTERLIRVAEHVPSLAGLAPRGLFPDDIGVRRCAIDAGGPELRTIDGLCSVNVKDVWSTPEVSFTEEWAKRRHSWRVTILDGTPRLDSQTGPVPPQLWK
ncbi:MAG: hypothetical protein ACJ757_09130 [Gaiellaceae bacterium]